MLTPPRTASRTKKKKKSTSSSLIGAPVQSQDARDAKTEGEKDSKPQIHELELDRVYLAPLASFWRSWRFSERVRESRARLFYIAPP
jgi:hypothetical protein